MKHNSVLMDETIEKLKINKDGIYVDATLGFGGHSQKILENLSEKGKLISFDLDFDSIEYNLKKFKNHKNVILINKNFDKLEIELKKNNISKIDGIVYDLGTSYYQLTNFDRGFTFKGEKVKLDMRMDQNQEKDAIYVLNNYDLDSLIRIFNDFGEEKKSSQLAKKIIEFRENEEIIFNNQLNEIIRSVKGYDKNKNPFKNIYQSIRIEVNNEFNSLEESLKQSQKMLKENGRIVVITFHSLEDRIVKNYFWKLKSKIKINEFENINYFRTSKTFYPKKKELDLNHSSKSAKGRVLIKNYE